MQARADRGERRVRHVLDVGAPGREALNHTRVRIHPCHVMARVAKCDGEREPHVTEPHDSNLHMR